ncbi:MAG: hypothetical protein J5910_09010 [Lachnospiraceae bacterium]|nr:hypothetical protein [Lachnospiraceae bacterium]
MYREQDLRFLQDIYDRQSNDIALLYGRRSCGLSDIITDFVRGKHCLYYRAGSVRDTTQKELFAGEIYDQTRSLIFPGEDYEKMMTTYINELGDEKVVIIFDDFQYLVRDNHTLINLLSNILYKGCRPGSALFLLASDDIRWVENDMIRLVGRRSSEISGVIKVNEIAPAEFMRLFPKIPAAEAISVYSFLGGKGALYNDLTGKTTVKDVVTDYLRRWSDIYFDSNSFLPKDIREPSVYNSILVYLASGVNKLNDIHKKMGIDRAKLSVYLKTLCQYQIVEKAATSIYVINDRTILFYYRFVFCHISSLSLLGPERFYKKYIEKNISVFAEEVYPLFCMDHVRMLAEKDMLSFKMAGVEKYYDKEGAIDFIITAAGGNIIACTCRLSQPAMNHNTYDIVKASIRKNRLECENIWLFSEPGFDQKLTSMSKTTEGLYLIDTNAFKGFVDTSGL